MARIRFTSKNLKSSNSKDNMPPARKTPRMSPRKKDEQEDAAQNKTVNVVDLDKENDSDGETAVVIPDAKASGSKQTIKLSVPEISLTGRNQNGTKSVTPAGSMAGSDKPFISPKESDHDSSETSDSNKNDSDDESIVKKKKGRTTRKRVGKAADDHSDDTHEMRKSGRTPKPVKPFQIKTTPYNSAGRTRDDSEEESDVNTDDDESDYERPKKKQNGKGGKVSGAKNNKNKRSVGRPRRKPKFTSSEEENSETDDDAPGLKGKANGSGHNHPKEPPTKKAKGNESDNKDNKAPTKAASISKTSAPAVVVVNCGTRVATPNIPVTRAASPTKLPTSSPRRNEPNVVSGNDDLSNLASVKLDQDIEYIDLKKLYLTKQIELMDHEIYCRKLDALKRERELCLGVSPITNELMEMNGLSQFARK